MGTTPEQWGLVPYTVRTEQRDMMLKTKCGGCSQTRYMLKEEYATKKALLQHSTTEEIQEAYAKYTYTEVEVCEYLNATVTLDSWVVSDIEAGKISQEKAHEEACWQLVTNRYGYVDTEDGVNFREAFVRAKNIPCPVCATGQVKYNRNNGFKMPNSTGYVMKMFKDVKINAYYPAWPVGTTFPSSYNGCDCEACGKTIRKSGTYGVVAQKDDGTTVGMFVGNACVKKFGFKSFKTVDAQAQTWADKIAGYGTRVTEEDIVIDMHFRSKKTFDGVDIETVDDIY